MLQSHNTVRVPPTATTHQLRTTQNVATARGKPTMAWVRSSQDWVCPSGAVIRFHTPAPGATAR
jgi:hypothetical protein